MDTQMVLTHTGKIYFNRSLGLEFLTVGDYGKENNIKADFLGLTKKIEGVQHHDVDLMDKWVATISSQKGCPMKCTFCDVHKYGFFGNASLPDLEYQIRYIIEHEDIRFTNRFNVHYARMGEPTWNPAVLDFTESRLDDLVKECGLHAVTIHPVVSTMMPRSNNDLSSYLKHWCEIKNVETKGGSKGYISNPKTMWWTCTCEGSDGYYEGLSYTVAGLEKNNLAFFYNRIGSYDFTKKNIPNRIKPLDREYTKSFCFHKINTQNIQESFIVDLGVISNKINELIAAVNELRENHE